MKVCHCTFHTVSFTETSAYVPYKISVERLTEESDVSLIPVVLFLLVPGGQTEDSTFTIDQACLSSC